MACGVLSRPAMLGRPHLATLVYMLVTALARPATAADAIDYEAPSPCPGADAFADAVRSRTGREPPGARVKITRSDGAYSGVVAVEQGGRVSAPRNVTSASCADVVEALAVVVSVAIEEERAVAEVRPEAARPEAARSDAAHPEAERAATAKAPPSRRLVWGLGAGAEAAWIADAVPSVRVVAEVARTHEGGRGPRLRLAGSRTLDGSREVREGRAELTLTKASLELCPVEVRPTKALALRPCAGAEAGILDVAGSGASLVRARERSRPWAAVSLLGGAEVTSGRVSLGLEAGAALPLVREAFFFEPDAAVWMAPRVAVLSRITAMVRFP